ncbi:Uncharacterised protein [Buttiauxella agrestis]|uniref:Phage tail protein E n=1 Tax=Buttiauxella agrestis TaxID=82977 RepID=A0A381C655_9ENTR|nr:phage tail assembly protein [Buttiauxella agrestis]SUW63302.1 Uncharacterised protein [Buttiauxella agrestis]
MNYPANTIVITLSRPFKLNGEEVTELTLREPRVVDKLTYEKTAGGPLVKESTMIATLCGLNASDIHNLPAYDYEQLTDAVNRFLLPPEERESQSS